MFIIGRNPILETLKYNLDSIQRIMLLNNLSDKKIKSILNLAEKHKIPVEFKNRDEFDRLLLKKDKSEGISQGILAEVVDFKYADFNEVLEKLTKKDSSIIVMLDEIQDPHNLGAIIRTSAAVEADAILISEKNSVKVNHTVIKASAGASNNIDIVLAKNSVNAIKTLKDNDYKIVGTALSNARLHYELEYDGHVCIIFGNEGEGVRKNILKMCDQLIKIPIKGKIESLNVSVAAGVILYEVLRQRMLI